MANPILFTKLNIPPLRPVRVVRSRLIDRLNEGLMQGCRLTLVSAPAGYGKTTVLADWLQQGKTPSAWLTLDERDNDPARFWAHFWAALQRLHPEIAWSEHIAASTPGYTPNESQLNNLINQLEVISEPLILVLDDYHSINNPTLHDQVEFLIDYPPAAMHLVIATRSDPPFPLSRLRGRAQLNELRSRELRFSTLEANAYLNRVMGLNLKGEEIAALEKRTEGWAVGLQMAALSIQARGETEIANFIASFTGSHRYIFDYLLDEVLQGLLEEQRSFLLHTSILERMTAPLCEAVSGQPKGAATLEALEAANLFLFPLDDERRWYRYHPLFADVLRQRLSTTQPERITQLHLQASQWYQDNGLILDAIKHALEAGDTEQVARLVGSNAFAMMEYSDLNIMSGWFDRLDRGEVKASPWLCLARAWLAAFTGRFEKVEQWLMDAEATIENKTRSLGVDPTPTRTKLEMQAYCAAVRSYLAGIKGNSTKGISYAQVALRHLPQDDHLTRSWALSSLAIYHLRTGNLQLGIQLMTQAAVLSQEKGPSHIRVMVLSNLGAFETISARLKGAAQTFREALRISGQYSHQTGQELPIAGYAFTYLARILLEWDEIEPAISHVEKGIRLCERWGEPQLLTGAYMRLAEVRAAVGDSPGAMDAIRKVRQAGEALSPQFANRGDSFESLLHLKEGNLEAAARWATRQGERLEDHLDISNYAADSLALARIEMAMGRSKLALDRLALLIEITEAAGAHHYTLAALAMQAAFSKIEGKSGLAMEALERAFTIAKPQGYIRTFIDLGPPMRELLLQAARRDLYGGYTQKLLKAFDREALSSQSGGGSSHSSVIEALTPRELEVLRLLNARLTRPQIARELTISENTARTHIKNIYGKLGVHSREDAIRQAKDLGLI